MYAAAFITLSKKLKSLELEISYNLRNCKCHLGDNGFAEASVK
jgi:hypothetical protein